MKENKKQKLLLEYFISSQDAFAVCLPIVRAVYFDPEFRDTVNFIIDYYNKYHTIPSIEQIKAETDLDLTIHTITTDKITYCITEIETFCRDKALEKAILASPALIEKGNRGEVERLVREAVCVSVNRNAGVDYFNNVEERLQRMLTSRTRTSTSWIELDEIMYGGFVRGELYIFTANSGGGKSIVLQNIGLNFSKSGHNVLYLSLELAEDLISQRLDTMVVGFNTTSVLQSRKNEIITKVEQIGQRAGKYVIKQLPSGITSASIRAEIKEFELRFGCVPDMLIIDYLDIMGLDERVSADNVFEKDKRVSEQLRNLGIEFNAFIVTASQQNRGAVNVDPNDLNQSHVAGGISKINSADMVASIILNDTMKKEGRIAFLFLKSRNFDGIGKTVELKWVNSSLRILNNSDNQHNELLFKKKEETVDNEVKNSVLSIIQV